MTITGYYFFRKGERKYVLYSSIIGDDRFASMHDCTELTDDQAKNRFKEEHHKEVMLLIKQKHENDQSKANNRRIIRGTQR